MADETSPPSPQPPPPVFSTTPSPTVPAPQSTDENKARMWNMLCHLSALSACVGVPFGNVLGPLLVWRIKKHEFPSVEAHGKAAINFQITMLIAAVVGLVVAVPRSLFCLGFLFVLVLVAIGLCALILPSIAGLKANDGIPYQYPFTLNLIK